tara:strand:- start:528 stop:632 length:105 start_codon:yes stop_codon:yes gene_type:complete
VVEAVVDFHIVWKVAAEVVLEVLELLFQVEQKYF